MGSKSAPDDNVGNPAGLHDGREGTRTHDLTDVNQVFEPTPARSHGWAVWADREYSGITIRAHYRSVASPCGLAIMCRYLEIYPDKPSFQGMRP